MLKGLSTQSLCSTTPLHLIAGSNHLCDKNESMMRQKLIPLCTRVFVPLLKAMHILRGSCVRRVPKFRVFFHSSPWKKERPPDGKWQMKKKILICGIICCHHVKDEKPRVEIRSPESFDSEKNAKKEADC